MTTLYTSLPIGDCDDLFLQVSSSRDLAAWKGHLRYGCSAKKFLLVELRVNDDAWASWLRSNERNCPRNERFDRRSGTVADALQRVGSSVFWVHRESTVTTSVSFARREDRMLTYILQCGQQHGTITIQKDRAAVAIR